MKLNRGMRTSAVTLISLAILVGAATAASAQNAQTNGNPGSGQGYGPGYGYGPGMMGQAFGPGTGYGRGYGMGRGFNGGPGNGYGPGYGMAPGYRMGPGSGYGPGPGYGMRRGFDDQFGYGQGPRFGRAPFAGADRTGARIDASKVAPLVKDYLASFPSGGSLEVAEIMQFQYNYYVQIQEKNGGALAFELLVDPYSGRVTPEPGPNMMWNTRFGHMAAYNDASIAPVTVTPAQAVKIAADYLKQNAGNGVSAGKAEKFPGYYTLHVLEGGKITGMLSVNGYTGAVWYHNWHGPFEKMITEKD